MSLFQLKRVNCFRNIWYGQTAQESDCPSDVWGLGGEELEPIDKEPDPDMGALVAADSSCPEHTEDSKRGEGESDIAKHIEAALAVFDPQERVDLKSKV